MDRGVSFGSLLRSLRNSAGLTQEELAAKAGLTAKAISALERGERKRPYPHTVRSLAEALGLDGEEKASLLAAVPRRDSEAPTLDAPSAAPETRIPAPVTALVGRGRELEELGDLLERPEARLITLTGTGGVGKTQLALEAARVSNGNFPDGAAFVALAPVADPSLVVPTIFRTLGATDAEGRLPVDALISRLREKRLLLVLDNFEHVLEAAPEVAALMENCPDLTILATSRAPLRLRGETEYPVHPLALPASTQNPEAGDVSDSAAGHLFVERAKAALPSFEVTEENAASVAAICWRLSGLPLALELAATKVRHLDPGTLLARLDRALSAGWARDLPERQRTMRATLDWSLDLLHAPEKELFMRLSIFSGGWTLEAAEAVAARECPEDALDLLGNLVEQSLATVGRGPEGSRFGMLEPVRQYAMELLEESGEAEEARRRHAAYYLALAERGGSELRGAEQIPWLDRLEADLDNLRAAIRFSIERGEADAFARTAWESWRFWWQRGHTGEGRRLAEEASNVPGISADSRARLLFIAATLAQGTADFDAARPMAEESREIFRRLGDETGVADSIGTLGLIRLGQNAKEEGLELLREAVDLKIDIGELWGACMLLGFAAAVPLAEGDLDRARELAGQSLSLSRQIGAKDGSSVALHALANIARSEGDLEGAKRLFTEGLAVSLEVGEETNIAYFLEGLADIAASENDLERAAKLWGTAEAMLGAIEVVSYAHAPDRELHHRRVEEARQRADEKAWRKAWKEGRGMSPDIAVEHALDRNPA